MFLLISCFSTAICENSKQINIEKELKIIRKHPENEKALINICHYYISNGEYSKGVTYAEYMKNIGLKHNNNSLLLYSYIYLGDAQLMSGREKASKINLDKALDLAVTEKNDSALCILYGTLGQYSANIDIDYYRAIQWLYKGISLSKKESYIEQYALLLSKLAGIYYLKRDKSGLKYALESYDIGKRINNPIILYEGAINSAYMYFLLSNHDMAMKFVHKAEKLMKENNFYDTANTYNLLGNLLFELKDNNKAIEYYKKAMSNKQSAKTSSIIYAHLGYAKVLMSQNKQRDAIEVLKHGLAISYAKANAVYRNSIYEAISKCYEDISDYHSSLNYYKIFKLENDSLNNKEKERYLSELMFRYDTERQNSLIKQSRLDVVNKEKKIQQQYFILIVIIIIALSLYYLYRRKNNLYVRIIKQNQEAIKREEKLNKRIKELEEDDQFKSTQEKYAASSLTDKKSQELFNDLEKLMRDKKAYKDNLLTKDKVAEMLNTNRTYLSRIINEQTNLSFTHYINSFRIKEAVKLLSDPNNTTPLKAISFDLGFNSISTFYNLFQSSVGMTPTQYRNKVIELGKQ